MKVMHREVMRVLSDKMDEATELLQEHKAASARLGMSGGERAYRCSFGGGDIFHTFIFERDWNSLAEMEAAREKASTDSEMQEILEKWDSLVVSLITELYIPIELE